MRTSRRRFMGGALGTSAAGLAAAYADTKPPARPGSRPDPGELDRAAAAPVLRLDGITSPVIIDSLRFLEKGGEYFVHVRSKDGAEGVSVVNPPITVKDGRMTVPSGPGVGIKDVRALLSGAVEA